MDKVDREEETDRGEEREEMFKVDREEEREEMFKVDREEEGTDRGEERDVQGGQGGGGGNR